LIDLADLNFATTTTSTGGGAQSIGSFLDTLPPGGCGSMMMSCYHFSTVAATPTGVSAPSQSTDPFSFLGNLSAPPTTAVSQLNDPFGFLGSFSSPPTSTTSQSNNLFSSITTTTTAAAAQPTSMITIPPPPPVSHAPSFSAETPILPNLNDIFVPLETITPGNLCSSNAIAVISSHTHLGTATPLQIVSKNGVTVTLHFTEVVLVPMFECVYRSTQKA